MKQYIWFKLYFKDYKKEFLYWQVSKLREDIETIEKKDCQIFKAKMLIMKLQRLDITFTILIIYPSPMPV